MTSLWDRVASAHARRLIVGLALLTMVAIAYAGLALVNGRAVASDTVALAPARAAALIDATTGEVGAKVGEEARLVNAALPYSKAPVQAAQAFVLPSGETLDQRRALLCLTQAVYYEAGFEPIEGRRAVAQVILNRMRHPAFPKSVCGVIYQRNSTPVCQFTFVCDGSLYRRPAVSAWNAAEKVARAALAGYVERSVGGATHYHADYVAPTWAPMLTKISKLGAHIFYRWPGAWGQRAAFTGRYIGEPSDPLALRPPMPSADPNDPAAALAAGPITDGTQLKRAPNDVGGLLDPSKGWTLNIPLPSETAAASRAIADRQTIAPAPAQNEPAAETRVIASR